MENKFAVSTYRASNSGRRQANANATVKVTREQLEKYAEQLKDYLLKIDYTRTRSYDSSDDDRVEDSSSRWNGVKYCEINPLENSRHLVVQGDTVIGVMFVVRDDEEIPRFFLFDGSVQQSMTMGYSASHSSEWTYVNSVTLVKRGEGGVPEKGNSVNFSQSKMYPSI